MAFFFVITAFFRFSFSWWKVCKWLGQENGGSGSGRGVGGIKWPPRSRHVNRSPWFFTERFSRFSQRSHFWFYFRGHSLRWVDNKMSIKINTVDAARLYFWTKVRVVDLAAADEDALIMIIMRIMLQGFSCRRVTLVVRRLEVFSTRP